MAKNEITNKDLAKAIKDLTKSTNKKTDKLLAKQLLMEDNLKNVKEKMMTKDDKREILNAIDGIAKKDKDYQEEQVANLGAHNRIQEDINEVREHVDLPIKHQAFEPEPGGVL